MKRIYLDYAAATPLSQEALDAMLPYFSEKFYNPSATYIAARAVKNDLDKIRAQVAAILEAKLAEIVFTAGATEANNLAIQGVMRQFPAGELLVSAIEHESVMAPAELFSATKIPVDSNGILILNKLSNLINDNTVLISVMLVNNELGTIQPLREISIIIQQVLEERHLKGNKLPLYLHADAAQAGNYLDLHVSRLGVDLMSLNGGKLYGPKQSGCLFIKAGIKLTPQILGGGQEFNLRSGTQNVAATAGFAAALKLASENRAKEYRRIQELRGGFEAALIKQLPKSVLNGSVKHRAPHLLSLTINGSDNERLMMELDERGIECAIGSACSASSEQPSHVLSAIGLNEQQARSTLRFSLGKNTTKSQLEMTASELAVLAGNNR